jgi:hypothetical protein
MNEQGSEIASSESRDSWLIEEHPYKLHCPLDLAAHQAKGALYARQKGANR